MQIKLFTIPILQAAEINKELNFFLRSHNIVEFEKHLMQNNGKAYWCISVQYIELQKADIKPVNKKDYKKLLNEKQFERFSQMREIRKEIAVEDQISAYIVFTDAELAEIAKMEQPTANNIRTIKGIGDKKADKYGERLLSKLKKNEKGSLPDTKNN